MANHSSDKEVSTTKPDPERGTFIELVYELCTALHGGDWDVGFHMREGVWRAYAGNTPAHPGNGTYYDGISKTSTENPNGTPRDALIALIRNVRKELERQRATCSRRGAVLDRLARTLPIEVC